MEKIVPERWEPKTVRRGRFVKKYQGWLRGFPQKLLVLVRNACYISLGQLAASRFSSLSGALMCDSK